MRQPFFIKVVERLFRDKEMVTRKELNGSGRLGLFDTEMIDALLKDLKEEEMIETRRMGSKIYNRRRV